MKKLPDAQLAAELGIGERYLRRLKARGMPAGDVAAARAWREENVEPRVRAAAAGDEVVEIEEEEYATLIALEGVFCALPPLLRREGVAPVTIDAVKAAMLAQVERELSNRLGRPATEVALRAVRELMEP